MLFGYITIKDDIASGKGFFCLFPALAVRRHRRLTNSCSWDWRTFRQEMNYRREARSPFVLTDGDYNTVGTHNGHFTSFEVNVASVESTGEQVNYCHSCGALGPASEFTADIQP